jgi:hypothetical protein
VLCKAVGEYHKRIEDSTGTYARPVLLRSSWVIVKEAREAEEWVQAHGGNVIKSVALIHDQSIVWVLAAYRDISSPAERPLCRIYVSLML